MASITLKDVPDALLQRLRSAAARDRRSLNQHALVLLEDGLTARETAEDRARAQVAAWHALAGAWESSLPLAADIEGIYAARTVDPSER